MHLAPALLLAFGLAATPAQSGPREVMFPSDASCYLRFYSKAHLEAHPVQTVREIAVGPDQGNRESDLLILNVSVQLAYEPERFRGVAYCEPAGVKLACLLEGDAGAFSLEPARGGAVMLRLAARGASFEGASDFITLSGTRGDDRVFLIPPVPADSCP